MVFLTANFQLPTPFFSRLRVRYGTDRQTDDGHQRLMSHPMTTGAQQQERLIVLMLQRKTQLVRELSLQCSRTISSNNNIFTSSSADSDAVTATCNDRYPHVTRVLLSWQRSLVSAPRAGSGVVRIDLLRFLGGCRTMRLNQVFCVCYFSML